MNSLHKLLRVVFASRLIDVLYDSLSDCIALLEKSLGVLVAILKQYLDFVITMIQHPLSVIFEKGRQLHSLLFDGVHDLRLQLINHLSHALCDCAGVYYFDEEVPDMIPDVVCRGGRLCHLGRLLVKYAPNGQV